MKYRTEDYTHDPGTTFSQYSDVWEYSEVEGKPVVVDHVDNQKLIQSYEDCALDRIFSKFLPEELKEVYLHRPPITFTDEVQEADYRSDLDTLTDVIDTAEDYRERYGLSDSMPIAEVFATVERRAKEALDKLKASQKPANAPKSNETPGGDPNVVGNSFERPAPNSGAHNANPANTGGMDSNDKKST